jgi:hypothetical protein
MAETPDESEAPPLPPPPAVVAGVSDADSQAVKTNASRNSATSLVGIDLHPPRGKR